MLFCVRIMRTMSMRFSRLAGFFLTLFLIDLVILTRVFSLKATLGTGCIKFLIPCLFIMSVGEEYQVVKRERKNIIPMGKNITGGKGKGEAIFS